MRDWGLLCSLPACFKLLGCRIPAEQRCLATVPRSPARHAALHACPLPLARSGESHDTANSSQRSVLIPLSRASGAIKASQAVEGTPPPTAATAPLAGGSSKSAWGKPAPEAGAAAAASAAAGHQPAHAFDDAAYPPLASKPQPVASSQPQASGQWQQEKELGQQQPQQKPARPQALSPAGMPPEVPNPMAGSNAAAAQVLVAAATPALVEGGASAAAQEAAATGAAAVPAGLPRAEIQQDALAAEVAALRAEVARLHLQQQQADALHQKVNSSKGATGAEHIAGSHGPVSEAMLAHMMVFCHSTDSFTQVRLCMQLQCCSLVEQHPILGWPAGAC